MRTAYFSSARRPGVVLRVSRTIAPVPARASAQRRVSVATPERWHSKLSADRSAVSSSRVGAVTRARSVPGTTPLAVGDEIVEVRRRRSAHRIDHRGRHGETGHDAVPRDPNVATLRCAAGTVAVDVTSTPPIRSSVDRHAGDRGDGVGVEPGGEQPVTSRRGQRMDQPHRQPVSAPSPVPAARR